MQSLIVFTRQNEKGFFHNLFRTDYLEWISRRNISQLDKLYYQVTIYFSSKKWFKIIFESRDCFFVYVYIIKTIFSS